jgi:hypothetical protein
MRRHWRQGGKLLLVVYLISYLKDMVGLGAERVQGGVQVLIGRGHRLTGKGHQKPAFKLWQVDLQRLLNPKKHRFLRHHIFAPDDSITLA